MDIVDSLIQLSKDNECYNPLELADLLNVDIKYTDELPEGLYGLAVHALDVIFIDSFYYEKPEVNFLCTHELTHIVNDDGIQGYYNISNKTKSSVESRANREAIKVLVHFYFNNYSADEYFQVKNIMNTYGIPRDLIDVVTDEINNWKTENSVWVKLV